MGGAEEIDFSALEREINEIYGQAKAKGSEEREKSRKKDKEKKVEERNKAKVVGTEFKGRRYIRWLFSGDVGKDLAPDFMERIRENVKTSFFCRYNYSVKLRNIEDGAEITYY